jgi:hypothetical protein
VTLLPVEAAASIPDVGIFLCTQGSLSGALCVCLGVKLSCVLTGIFGLFCVLDGGSGDKTVLAVPSPGIWLWTCSIDSVCNIEFPTTLQELPLSNT